MGIDENERLAGYVANALDRVETEEDLQERLELVQNAGRWVKAGMELQGRIGPHVINEARERGVRVFSDMKRHDIPQTAANAAESEILRGADLVNLHVQGGVGMMRAATRAVRVANPNAYVVGITVLTSLDDADLLLEAADSIPLSKSEVDELYRIVDIDPKAGGKQERSYRLLHLFQKGGRHKLYDAYGPNIVRNKVLHRARTAVRAGLHGVVCSPLEVELLRADKNIPESFILVTPLIRLPDQSTDDQKRVSDPEGAIYSGANLLVVGRAIYGADDPLAAAQEVHDGIQRGLARRAEDGRTVYNPLMD